MVLLDPSSGHVILSVAVFDFEYRRYDPLQDGTSCCPKDSEGQHRNGPAEGIFQAARASS